jgi:hypothetical protein
LIPVASGVVDDLFLVVGVPRGDLGQHSALDVVDCESMELGSLSNVS